MILQMRLRLESEKELTQETEYYKAINWNAIEDVVDKATWEKLTEQFWLDTRIPLSNDLDDWRRLSDKERDLVGKVFGGLTLLDTLQSVDGVSAIKPDVRTQHEEAVLNNIEFMECYTKDHKLLTIDRGWVPVDQIKEGDIVLAYNRETETTRFERVSQTSSHFAENIYHIHAKNFDLKVSGGHRMLFEKAQNSRYRKDSWDTYTSHVLEAREFADLPKNPSRRLVLVRPFESNEKFPLSLQEQFYILMRERSNMNPTEKARITHYLTNRSKVRTDTCTVLFTFQSEDKIQKLYDLCDSLGYSVKLNLLNTRSKTYKRFLVSIPLEDFVKSRYDALNYQDFFSLADFDRNKAEFFIQELTSWCTYRKQSVDNHLLKVLYFTKSCEDWDFVQAIATLAGHAFTKTSTDYVTNSAKAKLYTVRICMSEKQNYLQLTRVKTDILEGEQVYGIEVSSSFLVVLAGDKPVISGNCVHAKSYSSIFSTLNTKAEIEEIFEWTANNPYLQKKAEIIKEVYDNGTPLQKKVASVFLESFLFYSGFFTPLWYLGNNKLPNVAEIIKLIIRDECMTKDQEVLTPKGWVSVADIRPQDLVLQFDKETRRTNFAPVSTISTDFAPKIYQFKSKLGYVDLKCTPNHRLIRKALTSDKLITRPADLTLGSSSYWLHPTEVLSPNSKVEPLSKWEEFYICLSKFGTVVESALSKHLVLSSSKLEIIAKMKDLLESLDITYKEYSYPEGNGTVLRISKSNQFGIEESKLKSLPKRPLNEVDSKWCLQYLETLFDWVGAKCSDNSYRYCSINKESVDYVQALCSLAGYKTRIREFEDRSPFSAEGLVNYSLTILQEGSTSYGAAVTRTELEGEQIYGIQVPSGYLVTRSKSGSVVVTGNSVHGTYIGYKFQLAFNELPEEEQEALKEWMYDLLYTLYENEEKYTEELYDEIGWTDEVKTFLRYNANKALMNLGLDPLFPESAEDVNPIIMNGISTGTSNHDFFSQVGNGYLLGQVEAMTDEDYTVGL
jgi:ribonucleotide reductase beta subunit family protein with ferritin-like domain